MRRSRPVLQCPAGKLVGFFMRFTIRDLVLVTAIVALAVGWWLDHRAAEAQRHKDRHAKLVLSVYLAQMEHLLLDTPPDNIDAKAIGKLRFLSSESRRERHQLHEKTEASDMLP
jgi:hypothetical protein